MHRISFVRWLVTCGLMLGVLLGSSNRTLAAVTPNIARLANQGMLLSNFHVAAYCAPTRSMLLTGVDNHIVGLGNMVELLSDNQSGKPGYEGYLNGRAATLATVLHDAGY